MQPEILRMLPGTLCVGVRYTQKIFPVEQYQKKLHTTCFFSARHPVQLRKKDVPKGATILPAVWSMKRKRRISMREIYKWKARINIDGSKQVYGVHYDETYSPVVAWPTTRFFLTQSLLNSWKTKQ